MNVDRGAALATGKIHQENHFRNRQRLNHLYGLVATCQNALIAEHCMGPLVLDVGAGYGTLASHLISREFDVVGIEIDSEKIDRARKWYGIDLLLQDFKNWDETRLVDTVVFREVLNHLDLEETLEKVARIAKRCVVFQGTEILPIRLMKTVLGHREYEQKTPEGILHELRRSGFKVHAVIYSDVIGLPLSGGWWSPPLVPNIRLLHRFILP